jgi:ubiquinone/menaquinone biosynthesis C-methylase UbiE
MLALANKNKAEAGVENVTFLKGHIERIPLPDASVDVVISNCVINLSPDKDAVLAEAFRVLKPGGTFAVSDVVWRKQVPDVLARSVEAWVGCVAGALPEQDYRAKLSAAGFDQIEIEATREFGLQDAQDALGEMWTDGIADALAGFDGALISAFVRGSKPGLETP